MKKTTIIKATLEMSTEMRAILDSVRPAQMQKGDLTREAAMAHWGIGRSQANERLNKLVGEGALIKVAIVIDGITHTVWRQATPTVKE